MLTASKWLLLLAGFWLMVDSILIVADIPNPLFGWPLPCPITLFLLGAGLLLFGIGSKTFRE